MRLNKLAVMLVCAGSAAFAQVPEVLLEACNAMPDAAKRLECFKAASARGAESPKRAAFEGMRRSLVAMQGTLEAGTSLMAYQSSLQDVARELALFERDAPAAGAPGVAMLRRALDTYFDAAKFWSAAITFYAQRGNSLSYAGGLPVSLVGLEGLVAKHNLPTRGADLLGINQGVPVDAGRSAMWRKARQQSEEGLSLLGDSTASPAPPAPALAHVTKVRGITVSASPDGVKVEEVDEALGPNPRPGDVITEIANERITSVESFKSVMERARSDRKLPVLIKRGDLATFVLTGPLQALDKTNDADARPAAKQ